MASASFPHARISAIRGAGTIAMSTNGHDAPSVPRKAPEEDQPKKLTILMLHGYTQSGRTFRYKTRALEKLLRKYLSASKTSPYPGGVELLYPTGPIRSQPIDHHNEGGAASQTPEDTEELDAWGWWRKRFNRSEGEGSDVEYEGLSRSLATIRETILSAGGIDGIIGFSQGACFATMVASLLDPTRQSAFAQRPGGMAYPEDWKDVIELQRARIGGALKFVVSYSGFYPPSDRYRSFYEPKIATPSLHFIGSLDTIVAEDASTGLAEKCEQENCQVVYHPGGHFVPVGKVMGAALVGFVKKYCVRDDKQQKQDTEDLF